MVLVGFVARTHGNRGEVILNSETDFPELRFRPGAALYARHGAGPIEALRITGVRFHQGRPILGLAGVTSIGEAKRLAGAELRVPAREQGPLPEGTYYHHELIGCVVVTENREELGRVSEVAGTGGAARLVVRGPRGEVEIPLAEEYCDVDVAGRRVVVRPPEGLLEITRNWQP